MTRVRALRGSVLVSTGGSILVSAEACVERGPHVGHDPDATQQAKQAVKEFVRTALKFN